jgi:thiol-disulfide isomerase/thioredoxin
MRNRRLGPGTAWAGRAVGLVLLAAIGCSKQEELVPDPGVSPFYPGPKAEAPGGPAAAAPAGDRAVDASDREGSGTRIPDGPLRPEDVERQLRIALRAASKGDAGRAIPLLDRILELEPANREALLGRAAIAMELSQRAGAPEERAAALEKAGVLVRTLRRTYEKSNKQELDLFAQVLYDQMRTATKQGHYDRAAAALKEVQQAGFEPFDRVEHDPELAALRSSPEYHKAMEEIDASNLARARGRVKDRVARPLDLAFGFNLKGLDDKPLSLDQYKGQVVLVDFWGTWCEPCRKALPGLAQLYYKHRRRGFEVIGLTYEPGAPDPETARKYVQQFVQQSGIPYRCAMGDEATQKKIPNFKGFPTTLLIDRAGKVRMLITENSEDTLPALDDAIEVLLAEPSPVAAPKPPTDAKAAPKPPADAKAAPKAPSPPAAQTKGTAGPR